MLHLSDLAVWGGRRGGLQHVRSSRNPRSEEDKPGRRPSPRSHFLCLEATFASLGTSLHTWERLQQLPSLRSSRWSIPLEQDPKASVKVLRTFVFLVGEAVGGRDIEIPAVVKWNWKKKRSRFRPGFCHSLAVSPWADPLPALGTRPVHPSTIGGNRPAGPGAPPAATFSFLL